MKRNAQWSIVVASVGLLAGLLGGCDKQQPDQAPQPAQAKPVSTTPPAVREADPAPAPGPAIAAHVPVEPQGVRQPSQDELRAMLSGSSADAAPLQNQEPEVPVRQYAPGEGPKIHFTAYEHNFGVTYDETELKTVFHFKNDGKSDLVIGRVATSCGCTAATVGKTTIPPGEEGDLQVTFKPKIVAGEQSKTVTVFSNDPDAPQTILTIKARMIQAVEMETMLRLGTVPKGKPHVIRLDMASRDPSFTVKSVTFDNQDHISYRAVPDAKPLKVDPALPGYQLIEFIVGEGAPAGTFNRTINLVVNASPEPGQPQMENHYTVRLFGQLQGDVIVNPTFMRVRPVAPGERWEASTIFSTRSGKQFNIKGVRLEKPVASVSNIETSFEPIEYQGLPAYRITVTGLAGQKATAYRGDVIVTTDIADEAEMKIAFNGQIRVAPATPGAAPGGTPATPAPTPTPAPR